MRISLINIIVYTLFITLVTLNSCTRKQPKLVPVIRDTTITPATSFSKLFLDSTKLELYLQEQKLPDTAAERLREFYKSRNYQFAWFTEDGLAEHTRSFWNLHNNYVNNFSDSALKHQDVHGQLDSLFTTDTAVKTSGEKMLLTELLLTKHFFEYSNAAYLGKVDPLVLQWYIPRKKLNIVALLDSFIARDGKNLTDWEPVNPYFTSLKKQLVHYYTIDKAGGWKQISVIKSKKYTPGDSDTVIKMVKQRLQLSGDDKSGDTTENFTDDLVPVIKSVQKSFGFKEDGIINGTLINALNVPVGDRIRQILINLERMRWLPEQVPANFIVVNIPEFRLHVFENSKKSFSIDIVVGKTVHSTVIFNDVLKFVVFSPYWNIPPGIVKNEIVPAIRRNRNYLAKMNMEQTGFSNGIPVVRQKPGGANALGRVKFIFPNSYNIYFHDTPSKSLFKEEKRAFSHGCIRLSEPQKLAVYLLRNQPEWTTDKIDMAMSASTEKWVTLKEPLPVYIFYFTAWVDSMGTLNFRDDIYGHDQNMATHLFTQ